MKEKKAANKIPDVPILFEDDNYIIFNKPAGLMVHGDGRSTEPALTDWILTNRPEMKDVGEPISPTSNGKPLGEKGEQILRPGIVHRLDKETSGAIVVAKNAAAFADLKSKFQEREVEKKYHTFVYGKLDEEDGTINRPIGRSKNDFRKWSAQRGARGEMREAITNYRVVARGSVECDVAPGEEGNKDVTAPLERPVSFVEVEPKTGRTHQIRVHFKAIHHPVVADSLYAPSQPKLLGFERLALHAAAISFKGLNGKTISAEAPYPKDFARAMKMLKENKA